ncbi:hypothetical protein AVEN_261197-1 [Araneus ventricosus]|uniref:Uncharacterized protein n=1 Tax=Araneus ventricosus TaxID=182803 RepID=A0A4Y2W723_ARAVE|nr:hypothetical protein AVEN_261197-1 [Araneus ventricosus]
MMVKIFKRNKILTTDDILEVIDFTVYLRFESAETRHNHHLLVSIEESTPPPPTRQGSLYHLSNGVNYEGKGRRKNNANNCWLMKTSAEDQTFTCNLHREKSETLRTSKWRS